MNKSKRILSVFIAILTCFETMSGIATTAFAAGEEMGVFMVSLPRAADPNQSGWGHSAQNYMNDWHADATNYFSAKAMGSYEGQTVYCIEPGVSLKTGESLTFKDESYWDNYPSNLNNTLSPDTIKTFIGRILQYGWTGNNNLSWSTNNATDCDEMAEQIATQLLIWETIVGERDSSFEKINASLQGKNNILDQIGSSHPLRSEIMSNYNQIAASVQNHTKLPSFFTRSSASANTYELKRNGTQYSTTLTDSNDVLGNYSFSSSNAGLFFSVSGNELTVSSATAVKGPISIKAEKKDGQRKSVVVWTDGNMGGGKQDLITYGATVSDPVSGYMNLEVKTGNMKFIKHSEDGKVADISFTIAGDGYSATKETNSSGEIDITDLNPGVYTVTEQAIDKYEPQSVQRVTVVSGQTSTATFSNVLKRGGVDVTKTSEDGLVEGVKFHLYGTSLSGIAVDAYAVTYKNGVAKFENVLIGSGYTLEEVDTAIRYVVPDSQTAAVEWNKVTNKNFTNILKKFRATVTKSDVETGTAQGDATLESATYGIYKGGTLIDSYSTDANGQFTTKYYICDDDWTIREINSSEGYLLDRTVHKVGAEPELYEIELNSTANDVNEQVVKGNIALIKHTDDGSTKIETPEAGSEFEVFLKSSGSYDKAAESERDYLVCDDNGYAATKDLPYGIYVVHQTKGWEGRELMPDFKVYISQDGATYRYLINNANFESYINVVKKDAETGKTIPYAGAGFQIYDPNGNLVKMTFTYPTPTTISTFYTNDSGSLVTPQKLPYGKDYSLVEVQAPYGYVLDQTPIYFDVTADNSTKENGITLIKVEKPDMAQKGIIGITKTGEVFSTVTKNGDMSQPIYSAAGLKNAVYEVTAVSNIYTPDGTLRASAGEVVDTITTDENGAAKTKELYLGKYAVKEIKAPYGMVLDDKVHEVELAYVSQEVAVTETDTSFCNDRQKVEITLNKVLEQDKKFGLGSNGEICDVSFGIYASKALTATDGTFIPADGLIEIVSVNADGTAKFNSDLPIGSYYVKEIATNAAYISSNTKYPVAFEYAGQKMALVKLTVNDGKAIENELIRGSVNGLKTDNNGRALGGAVIGLFKADTTEFTKDTAILTATSADDGRFSFKNIPYGSYVVREIKSPKGYVLSDTKFPVVIDKDGAVVEVAMENTLIKGNVQLTKVDKDFPTNYLSGATFEVYKDTNGNKQLDKHDELLGTMTEKNDGNYEMLNLPFGGYFVKETKAPKGFILDTDAYYFEILENGKTVTVENKAGAGFINAAQKGSLRIKKTSSDGKVEGFSFRITGNNYDRTFKTDANGQIVVEGLRIGDYTVSEVSDSMSKNYALPADKTVTIFADKTTIAKMHNELIDTPKTGDDGNPRIWATLAVVSSAGLGVCGVLAVKSKKKKEKED